ncbi:MAG: hypothetical protein ACEY3J_00645 [Arsenophonus sp.]
MLPYQLCWRLLRVDNGYLSQQTISTSIDDVKVKVLNGKKHGGSQLQRNMLQQLLASALYEGVQNIRVLCKLEKFSQKFFVLQILTCLMPKIVREIQMSGLNHSYCYISILLYLPFD